MALLVKAKTNDTLSCVLLGEFEQHYIMCTGPTVDSKTDSYVLVFFKFTLLEQL